MWCGTRAALACWLALLAVTSRVALAQLAGGTRDEDWPDPREVDWSWLLGSAATSAAQPDRELLATAGSWCQPGAVPPGSWTCREVRQPAELWEALADEEVVDIHVLSSLTLDTRAIPYGWLNRTSDVRLLGAEPGVSAEFVVPNWSHYLWLVMYGWLRFENLRVEGLMTMPPDASSLIVSDDQVWVAQTLAGVYFPEMEGRRQQPDDALLTQGGFLTKRSGLVLADCQSEFRSTLGSFLQADTLREFFWMAHMLGTSIHWPALPLPAVAFKRKLVFTDSFIQQIRLHNTSLVAVGNFQTSELEEAPLHLGIPQETCQTIAGGINGKDYVGNVSTAFDGSPCLPWASIKLAGVDFSDIEGNSCRNPSDHAGAWCFTASAHTMDNTGTIDEDFSAILQGTTGELVPYSWKYCGIPECAAATHSTCQLSEGNGEQYAGSVNTTVDGQPCQLWNQTSLYDRGSVTEPVCRNPMGAREGVWCWTDAAANEWGYCGVPVCTEAGLNLADPDQDPEADIIVGPGTDEQDGDDLAGAGDSGTGMAPRTVVIITACAFGGFALCKTGLCLAWLAIRRQRMRRNLVHSNNGLKEESRPARASGPRDSCTSVPQGTSSSTTTMNSQKLEGCMEAPPLSGDWSMATSIHPLQEIRVQSAMDDTANGEGEQEAVANSPSMLNANPENLGYVQLETKLGEGSFGQVWQCRWAGRAAACKIVDMRGMQPELRSQLAESTEAVYMKSSAEHPHVARVLHVYHVLTQQGAATLGRGAYSRPGDGQELWIVQELCSMGDLAAFARKLYSKPRNNEHYLVILDILREVMLALSFLHDNGIVHADLKLDNVLLQPSGACEKGFVCKVGDFGVSHALLGRDYYYSSSMSGEVRILAPEVLRENKISAKMDTFSFGVLMHELYCPVPPGAVRDTFPVACTKTLGGERPLFPADTPPAFKALAELCWAEDPEKRPADADIIRQLQAMRRGATMDHSGQ